MHLSRGRLVAGGLAAAAVLGIAVIAWSPFGRSGGSSAAVVNLVAASAEPASRAGKATPSASASGSTATATPDPGVAAGVATGSRAGSGQGPGAKGTTGTGSAAAKSGGAASGSNGAGGAGSAAGAGGSPSAGAVPSATAKPSPRPTPPPAPKAPAVPAAAGAGRHGIATMYGPARPGGACLTMTIPASRYTAAASPADFAGGAACGSYVRVSGTRGTILVKIDNLCPECAPGHLDLSDEAFAAIDDPVKGQVPIAFEAVRNPPVAGGIVVRVKDGSSQWWLGLRIDNAGNALASVEVADGAGPFHPLTRQAWGWTVTTPGAGPFRVRVRDVYGQTAVLDRIVLLPDRDQPTSTRLY